MKAAGMPDVDKIRKHIDGMNVGARLRGLEAVVQGRLTKDRSGHWLEISRGRIRLTPLTHKVQWDARGEREEPILADERSAWRRLSTGSGMVRVTGPLVRSVGSVALEVRRFERVRR